MKSSTKNDVEDDNLICPITLQIFRDPVVAADGQAYERVAIIQWVAEHGTSPLTRQPLNINELQADDYLRNLAAQQCSSAIPYNYDKKVDHAILQRQSSAIPNNYNINVDQAVPMQAQTMPNSSVSLLDGAENRYMSHEQLCYRHLCLISIMIMATLIGGFCIYAFTVGPENYNYFATSTTTVMTTIQTTAMMDEVRCWFPIPVLHQEWCCPKGWICGNSPGECNYVTWSGNVETSDPSSRGRQYYPKCEGPIIKDIISRRRFGAG